MATDYVLALEHDRYYHDHPELRLPNNDLPARAMAKPRTTRRRGLIAEQRRHRGVHRSIRP
jgi:hypothetical protein